MSEFVEWLEDLNAKDTKVRAVLKRSLAFDPGSYVPAYPYVEPFLKGEASEWRRSVLYLVAGLWAVHWRADRKGSPITVAHACATYHIASGSTSIERRFITLLDSDKDQLSHRLRQMTALLKEYPIDFEALSKSLLSWSDEHKRRQNEWARDFYRARDSEKTSEHTIEQEIDQ